jgi:carbamoylphosphate synthase large subunit
VSYPGPRADRDPEGFAARVHEVARAEQVELVLCGRDADLLVLAAMGLPGEIARTPLPREAFVSDCNDKLHTGRLLEACGVRYARTALADDRPAVDELVRSTGLPLIAKPRHGTGSVDVQLIVDAGALAAVASPSYVLQEYLPPAGPQHSIAEYTTLPQTGELSLQVVLGPAGELLGTFASENVLENGLPVSIRVVSGDNLVDDVVARMSAGLARLGAVGPQNVQGRIVDGEFVSFEVNCRCTGLTGTRALMGFNEIDALYESFVLGACPSLPTVPAGRRAFRYLTEILFDDEDVDRFATGRWTT